MKHLLIQVLEEELKGVEYSLTNAEGITHFVYPCDECGNVRYHLLDDGDIRLSIELGDIEALNVARIMFNRISGLPPMSKRNFVDLLIHLKYVAEALKAQLN